MPESEGGGPVIDYPRAGDVVRLGCHVFRVSGPDEGTVEVSVNGGAWGSCRQAAGYWWYDWAALEPGRHQAVARLRAPDGALRSGAPVPFTTAASD